MSLVVLCLNTVIFGSLVNYVAGGKVAQRNHDGLELLGPFIAARRDEKGEKAASFVRRNSLCLT